MITLTYKFIILIIVKYNHCLIIYFVLFFNVSVMSFHTTKETGMRKQSFVLIAILLLLSLDCQNPPPPAPPPQPENTTTAQPATEEDTELAIHKALVVQRRAVQKRWLDAATMVAEKTADPVAIGLANFIAKNMLLGQPGLDGSVGQLEFGTTPKKRFLLVIILPADVLRYPDLGPKIASTAAATFNAFPPRITIFPQPVSEVWQGLILLHEGAHASMYLSEPYDIGNPEINAMREVAVHEFCNGLIAKIGGPSYMALLDEEINRLKAARAAANPAPGEQFMGNILPYDKRLDQIFGPSKTNFEEGLRRATFYTHASFELINRDYGPESREAIEEKTSWYMNIHAWLHSSPPGQ